MDSDPVCADIKPSLKQQPLKNFSSTLLHRVMLLGSNVCIITGQIRNQEISEGSHSATEKAISLRRAIFKGPSERRPSSCSNADVHRGTSGSTTVTSHGEEV